MAQEGRIVLVIVLRVGGVVEEEHGSSAVSISLGMRQAKDDDRDREVQLAGSKIASSGSDTNSWRTCRDHCRLAALQYKRRLTASFGLQPHLPISCSYSSSSRPGPRARQSGGHAPGASIPTARSRSTHRIRSNSAGRARWRW